MKAAPAIVGLILGAMLAAAGGPARADWIKATGEYRFPPEVAEAEACRAAEERAKEDAIRHLTGEHLSSEQMMRCSDQSGKTDCALNSSVWTQLDGDVRAVRDRQQAVTPDLEGFRKCSVSLEAEVIVPAGKPDPSFDIGVVPNAAVYRDGEDMRIGLKPTKPMAVAIFEWLPYAQGTDQIARLYPNRFDAEQRISGPTIVPSETGAQRYAMKVAFPDGQPANRKVLDEYLVVVATREPIEFLPAYTFDEFHARLLELSRSDSRIVRKSYNVVRGD
jgi:hypothetical protein